MLQEAELMEAFVVERRRAAEDFGRKWLAAGAG